MAARAEHRLIVPEDLDGERTDRAISALLDVSRSVARDIVDAGDVLVDGAPVKGSTRVGSGSEILVRHEPQAPSMQPDDDVPFAAVYEDDHLIVVDKPVGVVVHPTSERSAGTLVHGLLSSYPELEGVGDAGRWGIVHRLDRDTSGLLLVARTEEAHRLLRRALSERLVERRYLALVDGAMTSTTGTIEAPIGRDPANPTRMRLDAAGRFARTHYRRVAGWDLPSVTLASVRLDTGRTHQIRVHMRSIHHPIIGDRAYGKTGGAADPGRPWLHARQLRFHHPVTGGPVDLTAPLPRDLGDSLAALGDPVTGHVVDVDGRAL